MVRPEKSDARLVTAGGDAKAQKDFVNPAVFHGSAVLEPTAKDLHAHRGAFHLLPLPIRLENVDDFKARSRRRLRGVEGRRLASDLTKRPLSPLPLHGGG